MKGTISRHSHVKAKGYSGVFHIQGGMITDADLNEGALIDRSRVEQMGLDAVASGAPGKSGVVGNATAEKPLEPFQPYLKPGVVYAEGVRGYVKGLPKEFYSPDEPLRLLKDQLDLPEGYYPEKEEHYVVYADLWHRDVHPLEDARLAEVAFHGALTSFRQKTMAQLKLAPAEARDSLGKPYGDFPKQGSGVMTLTPSEEADTGNTCDPCATEIPLDAQVANALFRVEIVKIEGTPQKPGVITLAWSMENGAEIADPAAIPPGFAAQGYAYEHSNLQIESHKGAFANPDRQRVGRFTDAPGAVGSESLIRRWDGKADFAIEDGINGHIGSGTPGLDDRGMPQITNDYFTVTLDFGDKSALVGDYWLVELRTNAAVTETTDERFYVVSPTPIGIVHHYAPLFEIEGEKPLPLSDPDRRAASFPPLTDIPASHVSYRNTCSTLYGEPGKGGAENVQQALDALCGLDTGQIELKTPCPNLFGDATTLDDALQKLCSHDFGEGSDRSWMKYMMDWGVVCGLKIKRVGNNVTVTPGSYMDWTGTFVQVEWDTTKTFKPSDIRVEGNIWGVEEPLCLGIERLDGKSNTLVVAPQSMFTRDSDKTLYQRNQACNDIQLQKGINDYVEKLGRVDKTHLMTAMGPAMSGTWTSLPPRMTKEASASVYGSLEGMTKVVYEDNEAQFNATMANVRRARDSYSAEGLVGMSRDQAYGRQSAAMIAVVLGASLALKIACKCSILVPDCPDFSQKPVMVPLGEVDVHGDNDFLTEIRHVCMLKCRRQALTLRTLSYYMREMIEQVIAGIVTDKMKSQSPMAEIAKWCCARPAQGGDGDDVGEGEFEFDPGKKPWHDHDFDLIPEDSRRPYDIKGWSRRAALDELTGNGIGIKDVIDLNHDDAEDRIAEIMEAHDLEGRIENRELLAPGDTVILLIDGSTALGYLLVEQGGGKYPYTPSSEQVVVIQSPGYEYKPPEQQDNGKGPSTDTGELGGKLSQIEEDYRALNTRIEGLRAPEGSLGTLQGLYERLDGSIEARLESARAEAAGIGGDMPDRLAGFEETLTRLAGDLDDRNSTLKDIESREADVRSRLDAHLASLLEDGLGDHEAAMQALLEGLAKQLGDTDGGHTALKAKLDAAGETLKALTDLTAGLESRIEVATAWIKGDSLTETLDQLQSLEDRQAQLARKITARGGELDGLDKRATDISTKITSFTADLPKLETGVGTLSETMGQLETDLADLLELRKERDATHQTELAAHQATSDDLTKLIDERIAQVREQLQDLTDTHAKLDGAIGTSDASLTAIERRRAENLSAAQADLDALVKELEVSGGAATGQLADLKALRATALSDATAFQSDATDLIKGLDDSRASLNHDISNLSETLGEARQTLTERQTQTTDLESQITGLGTLLEGLNGQLPEASKTIGELKQQLDELRADLPGLLEDRRTSDAEHSAAVKALSAEVSGLLAQIADVGKGAQSKLDGLVDEQASLDSDLTDSRTILDRIRKEYTDELGALNTMVASGLEQAQSDYAALTRTFDSTKNGINQWQDIADRLREETGPDLADAEKRIEKLTTDVTTARTTATSITTDMNKVAGDLERFPRQVAGLVGEAEEGLRDMVRKYAQEMEGLQNDSLKVIRAMRAERPITALKEVAESGVERQLAEFGLFTVGDLDPISRRTLNLIKAKDERLYQFVDDVLRDRANDYIRD